MRAHRKRAPNAYQKGVWSHRRKLAAGGRIWISSKYELVDAYGHPRDTIDDSIGILYDMGFITDTYRG